MKHCTKCVLPESFPGIEFDAKGVCNYCQNSQAPDNKKRSEYQLKFENLIEEKKGTGAYDVIIAYSGGKDSTYTMYLLAEKYNLNILAYTFDNGFISEKALDNIRKMTDRCRATSLIVRPSFEKLQKIFSIAATQDMYNTKTLDRASSICTTCIGHVKSLVLKSAIQMNIPLAAYGWSPGQAPVNSSIMQTGPRLQRFSHRTVRDPILEHCGDELKQYFLSDKDLETDKSRWPVNIHPLAFFDYNENDIVKVIESLGWEKPLDTDPNSSNCTLNALANYIHREKFGFHPYAWEIAGIVRAGGLSREEGIEKTTQPEIMEMVKYGADRLGISI